MRLQVDDVCAGGRVRDRATIVQKKTGRPVQFEITEQTRASIQRWLPNVEARHGQYLFPSRFRAQPHLSTRQCARIVHSWVESAGLDSAAYGTHSMRRTKEKAAQIYVEIKRIKRGKASIDWDRVPAFARDLIIRPTCPMTTASQTAS